MVGPDDKDDHPFLGENFLPLHSYLINEMAASLIPSFFLLIILDLRLKSDGPLFVLNFQMECV